MFSYPCIVKRLKVKFHTKSECSWNRIRSHIHTITADGTTKDYIKLKYKNDAILYVPTSQLDSIRKYVGGDAINPPINSLGSKDWIKTKEKVKKNLRAVAKELIELYAKREKSKGYAKR